MHRETIALFLLFVLAVGMGTSMVGAQPVPSHRVYGNVKYDDGSPVVGVRVSFRDSENNELTYDFTDSSGFYDIDPLLGGGGYIEDPGGDGIVYVYVDDWFSGIFFAWSSGTSENRDITDVPLPTAASVTTDSATNVTTNSATLNASIDYGDYSSVDVTFFYGKVGESLENTELETISTASYSKEVADLDSDSDYEFYAYIKFDGKENTGTTKHFTTLEKATLTVDTTPVNGEVFVDGSLWGTAPQTKELDAGTYTVSFGNVSGYTTPSDQTVTLTAGETKTVTGTYVVAVPDFSISVDPALGSVVQWGSVTTTVSITSIAGFSKTVGLSASGLPSGATVSFSPPSGVPSFDSILTISTALTTPVGACTVTITGTDGGKTHSCTYTLTVTAVPVNQPPTADADGPYSVDEEKTVKLDGTGSSDPDGDALTYSWTITYDPTGESSLTNSDTATPTFHAPSVDSDTNVTVKLIVDDGHGHTDSDTATVAVKAVAPPPAEFPWPAVLVIIIVIVVVAIWYWKKEEISRRLRKVLKKE